MVELQRQDGEIFKVPKSDYAASKRHCFMVTPNEGFDSHGLDFISVVRQLSAYIAKNKGADVRLVDFKVLIFEFEVPVRMRCTFIERVDCKVDRIRFSEIYKSLNIYEKLRPIEVLNH